MGRAVAAPLLAAVLALSACGGGATATATAPTRSDEATSTGTAFSREVRTNFLDSCLANAKETAKGSASEEQLSQTCECILGKVEQEYSEGEFAEFEKRLLGGTASSEESDQLVGWSTSCAEESAG